MSSAGSAPGPTRPWWEIWPSRREGERGALAQHGARKIKEKVAGRHLILSCEWPLGEERIDLEITFSELHPFFRPTVKSNSLRLHRHQNVFSSDICLLTEDTGEWRSDQYVADLIQEQLPRAMTASEAHEQGRAEDAKGLEEDTADPLYRHFRFLSHPFSSLIFDATWQVPKGACGFGHAAIRRPRIGSDPRSFDGALVEIVDTAGSRLSDRLAAKLVTGPINVPLIWVNRRPTITKDASASYKTAIELVRQQLALEPGALQQMERVLSASHHLIVYLYGDEIEYGRAGRGLGAVCLSVEPDANYKARAEYIATYPVSEEILTERTSFGKLLLEKRATLIGTGAIGNFIASNLIRNGLGFLRIADDEMLEPGNSVRWSLGRPFWGLSKTVALALHLGQNYPFTKIEPISGCLGKAFKGALPLDMLLNEGGLLIDATATFECVSALSYFAKTRHTDYVAAYATEGLYGGLIFRQPANAPYCFNCLLLHWADGNETYPVPPTNPSDRLRPVGCSAATFMGASFDAEEVSLQVCRTVVGMLTGDGAYADDWDGAVLALRSSGQRCLPRWEGFAIEPHANCCAR